MVNRSIFFGGLSGKVGNMEIKEMMWERRDVTILGSPFLNHVTWLKNHYLIDIYIDSIDSFSWGNHVHIFSRSMSVCWSVCNHSVFHVVRFDVCNESMPRLLDNATDPWDCHRFSKNYIAIPLGEHDALSMLLGTSTTLR